MDKRFFSDSRKDRNKVITPRYVHEKIEVCNNEETA